jgi:uncharacterized membrane protein
MLELFAMWALAEVLGLFCLPLTFTVFHNLSDRGWAFSKTLGLAVFAFVVWFPLMVLRFLPFNRLFIVGVALLLLACSLVGFVRSYRDILAFIRQQRGYLLMTELIFLGMIFLLGWLRSFGPNIQGFEMFMDEGFIASIMRSPHFPPNDMWYAGQPINYYYYAHYTMALLGKLLGQSPSVVFNTGICIFFGLCASNLFGLTCNIIAWARRLRARAQGMSEAISPSLLPTIPYGLLSFLMALIFGNLAATRQWWLFEHGETDQFGIWFGPSRVIKLESIQNGVKQLVDATINEFPAFSFLLSCFHAHVLALAFAIFAMGIAFNLLLAQDQGLSAFGQGWRRWLTLGCSALGIGGLFVMNGWDYPTYLLLALCCLGCQQWLAHHSRFSFTLLLNIFLPVVSLTALSLLLFLPFYLSFVSPSQGIGIVRPVTRSMLGDELLIFGLFAFLFLSLLLASVLKRPLFERFSSHELALKADAPGAAAFSAPLPLADPASSDLPEAEEISTERVSGRLELSGSGEGMGGSAPLEDIPETSDSAGPLPWTEHILLPLGALVYLLLCLVFLVVIPNSATLVVGSSFALLGAVLMIYHLRDRAHAFTLFLGATAFALIAFCELFYLRDVFADGDYERMNTVFKFYFQAWVLFSVSCAAGLFFILDAFRPIYTSSPLLRWSQRGVLGFWSVLLLLLVAASMIYPIFAPYARYANVNSETAQLVMTRTNSLDGLEYLKNCRAPQCPYDTSGDYEAIRWLNENIEGDPVIIETMGEDYSFAERVSTFTGLPTPMGWAGHEYQWRVTWMKDPMKDADYQRRGPDIDQIYLNPNSVTVLSLMARYHAEYLYVGALEKQKYSSVDLQRFREFMQVVYNANGVTIYKVR